MRTPQSGILLPLPDLGRYLSFSLEPGAHPSACLCTLREVADGERTVVGFGRTLASAVGAEIPGLRSFPVFSGPSLDLPATPSALWLWLRGDDRGEILHRSRRIAHALARSFRLDDTRDSFVHDGGRDLTGYEDGTENPVGERALGVAIVNSTHDALRGSSFVAVQRWEHDFSRFDRMPPVERDLVIGRRRSDNEEVDDAPVSAHVKRTAQESFSPEAFVLRRSMPWSEGNRGGLMFVAFATSFEPFEAQMRRMVGLEDGVVDALFRFTRPQTGAYFWCPAVVEGRLDLSLLGL